MDCFAALAMTEYADSLRRESFSESRHDRFPAPSSSTPPATPRAPPSCGASSCWRRWCWRRRLRCSSRRRRCCRCIRRSASSRPLPKPPPSAVSPTGMPWWPCSQAAGTADPAHRDHPEQPAPHRRQARRIHRGAFPRSRAGRGQTAPDRFRRVHRRLAARPQAQRGSRALCAAAAAGSGGGDGELRPDDLRQPPHHRATDVDRSRAARRRHAARLREGGPASGPARRYPARGASDADAGRDHGDDPREDPRRIADAAETLSRRQVSGEQDRGVGDRLLRGSPQRSRTSVPRRVRPHGAVASSTGSAPIRPMPIASTA